MAIDSDKDFETSGKIESISRGKFQGSYFGRKEELVTLVIKSEDMNRHQVDFPIKTDSDIELMPFQSALIGTEVKYSKRYMAEHELHQNWKMEILSGPMKGQIYEKSGR